MELTVGLQLYTLREETKKDFAGTLEKVAEIGYKGIEFAGFAGIDATRMRSYLDRLGLVAIGSHTKLSELKDDLKRVFEYNREIGSKYIICPYADYNSAQDFIDMAKLLNEIGKKCYEEGFTFCYHNHAHELKIYDGEYGLDILFRESDSRYVKTEIDTCFVKIAGLDPSSYIRKYSGRCPLIHLKDVLKNGVNGTAELGNGILDIKGIVKTSYECGAEWLIIEQEYFKGNCLDSIKESFENLKKLV